MSDPQLDADLKALVAACFAIVVPGLIADAQRLADLAKAVGIPPERLPAIRDALQRANSSTFN